MKKNIFLFTLLFALQHFSVAQNSVIDSLQSKLKVAAADTNKANILSVLSYEILNSNTDSAIYYARELKNLSEELNYPKGITSAYFRLGQAYNNLGNYDSSQTYLSKALAMSTDKSTTAKIYDNIGINHWEMGNYPEALKNYFTGLKAFEEAGDKKAIGSTYNNIGIIYYETGNYSEALKNHLAALKIRQENGDKRGIAGSNINIGNIYLEQGNYTEALKNYFEAKKLYEETGDKYNLALAYSHIGLIYKKQGKYDDGLKNYLTALKIQEEVGDKEGISISDNNIGILLIDNGKVREAKEWLEKSLQLAKEMGIKSSIKDAYQSLSRADSALGNYKDAYANHKMYILYRDSILNKENTEKIVQQKMQYEFDKKETRAKAEQAMTEKELQRQKLVRNGLAGGFAVGLRS